MESGAVVELMGKTGEDRHSLVLLSCGRDSRLDWWPWRIQSQSRGTEDTPLKRPFPLYFASTLLLFVLSDILLTCFKEQALILFFHQVYLPEMGLVR